MAVRVNAFSHPERRPGQIRKEPNPSISCFESRQWWRHASRVTCRAFPSAVLHSSPRFSERQYVGPQAVRFAAKHSRRASRHVADGAATPRPRPSPPRPQDSPLQLAGPAQSRPRNTTGQSTLRCPAQREITSAVKRSGQRARRRQNTTEPPQARPARAMA
jgi:hypothetical protein